MTHLEALAKAEQYQSKMAKIAQKSYWKPQYHISAPANWINDPNGFCYFKDEYHVFYQYHPYSSQWGPMHWGHVASKDLVNWKTKPIALAPTDEYDRDGCFSGSAIEKELPKLEKITKNVVHTASTKDGVDKDFTDVIMLDAIYRSVADKENEEVYVLFTGDAHFTKVVQYLKELGKKVVIYGVKYGFSNRLKSEATSYVEMPRQSQEKNHYNELILTSLNRLRNKPKTTVTYGKTVKSVSEYNHVPYEKVKLALDNLLKQKYILEKEQMGYRGHMVTVLEVDWDRLNADGLWTEAE